MATSPPINHIVLTLPAYNEAPVIGELLSKASEVLRDEGIASTIIVVDDGSSDDTAGIVRRCAEKDPSIVLVQHPTNRGLGPAILTGLIKAVELAPGDRTLVVCMDADLTHPPEVISSMVRAAEAGTDVVIASRFCTESVQVGINPWRRLLSWGARNLFQTMVALPGVRDYTCAYRGIRASWIARALEHYGHDGPIVRRGFACTDELLIKLSLLGPTIGEVPFILRYDLKVGKSKIRLGVTILETLRLVWWSRGELRRAKDEEQRIESEK